MQMDCRCLLSTHAVQFSYLPDPKVISNVFSIHPNRRVLPHPIVFEYNQQIETFPIHQNIRENAHRIFSNIIVTGKQIGRAHV